MDSNRTVFIAETDEDGAIMCVWVDKNGQRSVRPFNPKRNRFDSTGSAEFCGAKPEAIKSWLAHHQQ